jgi:hypothetical protein
VIKSLIDFNESEKNKFIDLINSVKPCVCFSNKESHEIFNKWLEEQTDVNGLFKKIEWYEYEGLEEKYIYVIPMGNGKPLKMYVEE